MNNNSENQNYCADECSDHIKKIVNKSDELMEITRDEVFKYEKELKEKTIISFGATCKFDFECINYFYYFEIIWRMIRWKIRVQI